MVISGKWDFDTAKPCYCSNSHTLGVIVLFAFKKEYRPLIISGRKAQTIRVWKPRKGSVKSGSSFWLREGQVVKSPGLGMLRIDEVVELRLNSLTREDARLDGFKTRAELLRIIRKIYKLTLVDNPICCRVRFKYLGKTENERAPHAGKKSPAARPKAQDTRKQVKKTAGKQRAKPQTKDKPARRRRPKSASETKRKKNTRQQTLFPPF